MIVKNLALQYPHSNLSKSNNGAAAGSIPLTLYLAARDAGRGQAAVDAIKQDERLVKEKVLRQDGGLTDVVFKQLDVTDSGSIMDFSDSLMDRHKEHGLSLLVNNAGISLVGVGT